MSSTRMCYDNTRILWYKNWRCLCVEMFCLHGPVVCTGIWDKRRIDGEKEDDVASTTRPHNNREYVARDVIHKIRNAQNENKGLNPINSMAIKISRITITNCYLRKNRCSRESSARLTLEIAFATNTIIYIHFLYYNVIKLYSQFVCFIYM